MAGADPGGSLRRDRPMPPGEPLLVGRRSRPAALASALLLALRDPVVVVFLLAAIFDALSGDSLFDAMALFAVAASLGWDRVRSRRAPRGGAGAATPAGGGRGGEHATPAAPTTAGRTGVNLRASPRLVLASLAYATVVGGFSRFSLPVSIAVVAPGTAAVAVAWRGSSRGDLGGDQVDPLGAVVWASVFVALALWELTSLLLQPSLTTESFAHPTISFLMDPVLSSHFGRSVGLWLWLASGWFLLQR
jgi:hypothetical protein